MSTTSISKLFEQIVQMSGSMVVLLEADGTIKESNPLFEKITGCTSFELKGKRFFHDLCEPIDSKVPEASSPTQTAFCLDPQLTFIRSANGKRVYVDWVFKEINSDKGHNHCILAVGRNVSDRMRHEKNLMAERAELLERNKELTCLYEMAKIAADGDNSLPELMQVITAILPPAFQYPELASARIQLDGRSYTSGPYGESDNRIAEDLVIQGRQRGSVEVIYTQPHQPGAGATARFLDEERSLLKTIASQGALMIGKKMADEIKNELEGQLRHADRLAKVGQLAAGVAHELNEPLGSILGFAQLAAKNSGVPEQVARDLGRIIHAALHAREVIKKLMLFSRQMPNRKTCIDLNKLIAEAISFIQPRFARQQIQFEYRMAPHLPPIDADPSQITQVLVNLVINALQAMNQGGKLTITTAAEGSEVVLSVRDTGCGIARDIIDQIFLPFFTTKEIDQGTGLGLSVVHGIIAEHDGRIEVHSQPGSGSCFTIWLPASGEMQTGWPVQAT